MLYLACLDQILYGTGSLLNGSVWIDAMLVEELISVRLQALQRAFGDLLNMVGPAVGCRPLVIVAGIGLEPRTW